MPERCRGFLVGSLVGLLSVACQATAQRTLVVDNLGRPGAQYASIQAAVDEAEAGDIVLVRASASPYAGATITRGVRLLGEAQVTLDSELIITEIRRGEHVAVANFTMRGVAPQGFAEGRAIRCSASSGTIHFENVQGLGSQHGPALRVEDCVHVSGLDCTFDAGASSEIVFWFTSFRLLFYGADVGVESRRSAVLLTRCTGAGALSFDPAPSVPFLYAFKGNWPAITADASHLVLVECQLTGGDGVCLSPMIPIGAATPALRATGSSTLVTKQTGYTGGLWCGQNEAGIWADGATVVVFDPGVPFTSIGGQLVPRPMFDLQTAGAGPGATLALTLRGSGAAPYATIASFPAAPFPAPPIGIWPDLLQALPLFQGVVNGTQTDLFRVPSFLPPGLPAAFQTVLLVGAQLELSTPVVAIFY